MRLLLAEDEKEMSNAICAVLKHEHFSVDAVYDGQAALDYLESGEYDGAILDIMMPKMDGITVLKKLRSSGITTPVIMLTAKSQLDDKIEGLDAGADDYLTKPFAMKELIARIRSITRRTGGGTDNVLTFSDITLSRSTFCLKSTAGEERLANKEFQMLEMLMEHPGQVISADQFMGRIWGYDSDTESNVVWVYISNLRKKLKKLGSTVNIKAARGLGYSIETGES